MPPTALEQRIAIIADDLTGALDAGLQFAARGLETGVALGLATIEAAPVMVLNADTRCMAQGAAVEQMRAAARLCAGRLVFKKVDSTLRGHVGPEGVALRDALGLCAALVAPAFIAAGRTVQHGQLWVGGVPVQQTSLARDPQWPAQTADVVALVGRGLAGEVGLISLQTVRQGPEAVASCFGMQRLAVAESETGADLATVAQAIIADGRVLPCGSAGLAAAWAEALHLHGSHMPHWPGAAGPVLLVSGSRNAATQGQLQAVRSALRSAMRSALPLAWFELDGRSGHRDVCALGGRMAAALMEGQDAVLSASFGALLPGAALQIAQMLGEAVGIALAGMLATGVRPAGLVLTGGDTALHICQTLQITALTICGAVEPGIPGSWASQGAYDGLPIVTKAGGFGSAQALWRAVRWIKEGEKARGAGDG